VEDPTYKQLKVIQLRKLMECCSSIRFLDDKASDAGTDSSTLTIAVLVGYPEGSRDLSHRSFAEALHRNDCMLA
jgi:hypothetical protein